MIIVGLDSDFREQAHERIRNCPPAHRNAPFGDQDWPRAFVGFTGEVVAEFLLQRFRIPFKYSKGDTRYDYEIFGQRWEAKSAHCTRPPLGKYESNVSKLRYDHQRVFGYLFMSIQCTDKHDIDSYHTVYVCGCCTRELLEEKGVDHKEGEIVKKCTFSYDCRSIQNRLLTPLSQMASVFEPPELVRVEPVLDCSPVQLGLI
jgi:hypothetical protein